MQLLMRELRCEALWRGAAGAGKVWTGSGPKRPGTNILGGSWGRKMRRACASATVASSRGLCSSESWRWTDICPTLDITRPFSSDFPSLMPTGVVHTQSGIRDASHSLMQLTSLHCVWPCAGRGVEGKIRTTVSADVPEEIRGSRIHAIRDKAVVVVEDSRETGRPGDRATSLGNWAEATCIKNAGQGVFLVGVSWLCRVRVSKIGPFSSEKSSRGFPGSGNYLWASLMAKFKRSPL